MSVPYKIGSTVRNPAYVDAWRELCEAADAHNTLINLSWTGSVNAMVLSAAENRLQIARANIEGIPEWILVWSDQQVTNES